MRVAVYTIALNEAQHVDRWFDSVRGADVVVVCDTGSTDSTAQQLKQHGVTVVHRRFHPFRFDEARNHALSHIPNNVDWCISLDMDEVLQPGWREQLERTPVNADAVRHTVVTSFTETGEPGQSFTIARIHRRHTHTWRYPIHEVLHPVGPGVTWMNTDIAVHHHPDNTKPRTSYLPMLQQAVDDNPRDARMLWYLGREHMFHRDMLGAEQAFYRYLDVGVWAPERAAARRYLADIEGPRFAEQHLWFAVAEDPYRRETWVRLAQHFYDTQDWAGCEFACRQALRVTERPTDFFCEPWAWGWLPHDLLALACWHQGDIAEAVFHGQEALRLNPGDVRLADNVRWYTRRHVAQNETSNPS